MRTTSPQLFIVANIALTVSSKSVFRLIKPLDVSLYNSYTNLVFHQDGGHFVVVPDYFLSFLRL